MAGFSTYLENKIGDHLFGKGNYTPPTIWVGLSTADPTDDASGLAEPSGNGYARVQTAPADWNTFSGGATLNANEILYPEASGPWGTLTHFALFDAATGGNMLTNDPLGTSKSISSGDTAKFAAGELAVSID